MGRCGGSGNTTTGTESMLCFVYVFLEAAWPDEAPNILNFARDLQVEKVFLKNFAREFWVEEVELSETT
jgi:hypothetical protein